MWGHTAYIHDPILKTMFEAKTIANFMAGPRIFDSVPTQFRDSYVHDFLIADGAFLSGQMNATLQGMQKYWDYWQTYATPVGVNPFTGYQLLQTDPTQTLCICLIWMREAIWGGYQPQPLHNDIMLNPHKWPITPTSDPSSVGITETSQKEQTTWQTPSQWWWSCLPLQRCGFDESMPIEGRAALYLIFLRPLLNSFHRFIKLKKKLTYLY